MKTVILGLIFAVSAAQAATCEIKIPKKISNRNVEVIEEQLSLKGYTVSSTGRYRLWIDTNVDHRGHQYVISGYSVEIRNPQSNIISSGTARWKLFKSQNSVVLKALKRALKALPECQD